MDNYNSLRDKLASKYCETYDCPCATPEKPYCSHDVLCGFKAGWDAALANAPEREQASLKEELSKIVTERDQLRAEVERLKANVALERKEVIKMHNKAAQAYDQLARAKAALEKCVIDPCGFDLKKEDLDIVRAALAMTDNVAQKALAELERSE